MKDKAQQPSHRILCVEDNKDTCEVLSFMFRGYELKFAHSIAEAEPLIADQEFDLYILDNWLPDGSGVELCKKIRRAKPDTPIVFTSAVAFQKSVDEATAAGANRYLVKPIEPDQLKQVVKELLSDDYNLSI